MEFLLPDDPKLRASFGKALPDLGLPDYLLAFVTSTLGGKKDQKISLREST
jgi:hypothetical protein